MMDNIEDERSGFVLDERFELLSAYLDGEVTASERQQVEALLATDRAFERQYRQMQNIQVAFPRIAVPSSQSATALTASVFEKIDRQRNRKLTWIGGGAIAATLLATVASFSGLFGNRTSVQFATHKTRTPAPLMVALNDPILAMPSQGEQTIELPMSSPEVNAD